MDEKFAITFGMGDITSLRHLRPPVSTFHFSSLVGDHFTNFGYHTVAKSSTPFSEAWHSGPRTPILMTPGDSTFHSSPTPWHFYCHLFVYGVCKATLSAFPFSFIGERSLKSRRFLFSRIANFSPRPRNLRNFTHLDVASSQSRQLEIV